MARFHAGDADAMATLLGRYRGLARSKTRTYFLVGADADDIEQEALIGLFKAARDFRADRGTSFGTFAEVCVTRQVISAIKGATRHKHQALNRYVSISCVRGTDEPVEVALEGLLRDHRVSDPADQVVGREQMASLRATMAEALSHLEVDVLRLYVEGKSYQEIGVHVGRHAKSVDNALQRIKRKLDHRLQQPAAVLVA